MWGVGWGVYVVCGVWGGVCSVCGGVGGVCALSYMHAPRAAVSSVHIWMCCVPDLMTFLMHRKFRTD